MNVALYSSCFALIVVLSGCSDASDPASEAVEEKAAGEEAVTRPEPATRTVDPEPAAPEPAAEMPFVETTVIDRDGNEFGTLSIEPVQQGVRLALHVEGLPPGEHAVHFHETGQCEPPGFESAGGHYNPTDARHGMTDMDEEVDEKDHHVGDMLNQTVDDQGELNTVMVNDTATLADGQNTLLDDDGSALVIHADPDDYESQPSGNAGDRLACAVISRERATGQS